MAPSAPVRKGAPAEKGLRGPAAEKNRERDAVSGKPAKHQHARRLGMAAKQGMPVFGDENRAAPTVRDADAFQNRMKTADAPFERAQTRGGSAFANAEMFESAPKGLPSSRARK